MAIVTDRLTKPWEDAQEAIVSPGAFMTEYAPLSSREAEKLHEEFARDFLASLNDPTINSAATERLSQKIYRYQDFIFVDDPDGMSEEEKKQKEQLRALGDWVEYCETIELEKERMRELSAADKDFLGKQMVSLGGVRATALDWVNAMDNILDHWDKSFDRMVSEGHAKPEEKDKKKLEVERLRKLMARTDISEAEKQKLIEQGIANGTFSRDTVDFVTHELSDQQKKYFHQTRNERSQTDKIDAANARSGLIARREDNRSLTQPLPEKFRTSTANVHQEATGKVSNDLFQANATTVVSPTSNSPQPSSPKSTEVTPLTERKAIAPSI